MDLSYQIKNFIIYILIGNILGVIFDFFRASRKNKKIKVTTLMFQDIIYFILVTGIIIFTNIFILKNNIRFYFLLGFVTGIYIYITLFSNLVVKNFTILINLINNILSFTFLPIKIVIQNLIKIFKILYKISKNYCKKTKNMVSYIISKINKRGSRIKYERKRKNN